MGGFEQVAWFPLCAGLTALGLVASWFAWRRRGAAAGLRLAAWSLLPLAAYLVGIIGVLWDVGTTIVGWAVDLVISPLVWAGVALAGLSVVAFVVSGVLKSRRPKAPSARAAGSASGAAAADAPRSREIKATRMQPAGTNTSSSSATSADDDFSDVEEILRRRGIT